MIAAAKRLVFGGLSWPCRNRSFDDQGTEHRADFQNSGNGMCFHFARFADVLPGYKLSCWFTPIEDVVDSYLRVG